MGNSPTASLIFGFPIDTDQFTLYDFDQWVDQQLGREKPTKPDHKDYSSEDWEKWRKDNRLFEANRPFMIAYDGSADSNATWYFCSVCISGSWDYPTIVENDTLKLTQPDETKKLREEMLAFCEANDISWEEPKWQLLAAYG